MNHESVHFHAGPRFLSVRRHWCKGCNLCVVACPAKILSLDEEERVVVEAIDRCIFCGICAARCPDFVFSLGWRTQSAVGGGTT